MDDIIRSIIDIDRGASDKLSEAEKKKLKIITEAKALQESIVKEAVENSKRELEQIEADRKRAAEEKIAALEADRDSRIDAMKKAFAENSDKWADEIFKAVISG